MSDYEFLNRLLDPLTPQQFFDEFWDRKAFHLSRNEADYFSSDLSSHDVEDWLSRCESCYESVTLDGHKVPDKTCPVIEEPTGRRRIDKEKLYQKLCNGLSIKVALMSEFMPSLSPKIQ